MDGVVKVTKQDRRLHVVFTSSDSFFEKWLTGPNGRCLFVHINEWTDNLLFSSWAFNGINAEVFVLGDLTIEEAVQYYQSLNPLMKDRAYFKKTVFPA
jgi:hypothetical protein